MWMLAAAVLGLGAGCGGEELDTGEPVPPATEVVTDTVGDTTATETEATTGTTTGDEEGGGDDDAAAGEQVFASAGCGGCHTLSAAGASGTVGPNLDERKPSEQLVVTRVTNGRGAMPAFKDQLSEQQIRDVAAYVSQSAGS